MDPIKLYLKEIKDIPLLTPEEELKLARRIKRGDRAARKAMIQANLRLVINIAKRYSHFGVSLSDLVEEGNIGLMKAVAKFNPKRGYRFSTYAAWWIRQYITRAIANQGKMIRIPVYMAEMLARWKKVHEELCHKMGRTPTVAEVAKRMRISIKRAKELNEIVSKTSSLDAPIGEDDAGAFMDLIEDENAPSPADELSMLLRKESIANLLNMMGERERKILMLRFGLKGGSAHTLSETAKHFGITRERVRQIENDCLKKLKAFIASQEESYR